MQSPSSILNFPSETTSAENKVATSGVTTNLLYKLSGYVAYTSVAFTAAINTLTAGGETEPEPSTRKSYNRGYLDDVMQINADDSDGAYDEMSDVEMEYNSEEINKKVDRKDDVKWAVNNDDEEEPPPPYDSSWAMPKNSETNSRTNNLTDAPSMSISSSSATSQVENNSTSVPRDIQPATISQTIPRRRQIRVRRPRRLLRRKSTEASTPRGGGKYDDPEQLLLKVNDKLSDMIAEGRAALTSTVDVTEVEMILAEERERDERIAKEIGLQTPVGRKGRKNTVDYDYHTDGNYSSPEYFDYGFGTYSGHGSGFTSPSGYDSPTYTSHGHYNTPSQFGSPGTPYHHQTQAGFNYSNLGYKFSENEFNPIPNQYYGQSSNGYAEPAIPKGFGSGPLSGGFGAKFGRYGSNSNNGGFGSYGHNFGSNVGGFGSNVFGSNSGYRTNGMYNNLY